MRRQPWFVALVLFASACGGGASGDDAVESANEFTSFTSSDGVVSLVIPPGAAPEGFTATLAQAAPSSLGVDISDVDSVFLVYELGPDGTEFDEPVTVTFRISAVLGGFDPSLGLPPAVVVIEDGAGGFEPLGSLESSMDGDVLVVQGTTTHFSSAVARVQKGQIKLVVDPPGREKAVESLFEGRIEASGRLKGSDPGRIDYSSEGPIEVFSIDGDQVTWECRDPGVGIVRAEVYSGRVGVGQLFDKLEILAILMSGGSFTEFLGFLTLEIECVDTPASTTSSTSTPAEEPPEDLDAIASSAEFFACPLDYQLDIIGRLLSGKDGEQSEHIAETPVAEASNVACTKFNKRNPDVFTMIVEGDGESLSTAENTSYQVRFVVNNEWPVNEYYDDTGFEVLVEWNRLAKQWVGVVRDQQGTRVGNDADVAIEWLDSSTLQVVVDVPGFDVEVTEMRTELNVFVTDDNDVRQYDNFDVAIWRVES